MTLEEIEKKYRPMREIAEAKQVLKESGYDIINETSIAAFADSESKDFLIDVLDNLENNGHVDTEEIDKLDKIKGYIWNQLNKIAQSFSIEKIITFLKKLNLFD